MTARSFQRVSRRRWWASLLVPLVVLLPLSAGFHLGDWDRTVMGMILANGGFLDRGEGLAGFLYRYGVLPALLCGLGGFVYSFYARRRKQSRVKRATALALALTLLLGPGLLVNTVFKHHYGRPRPLQTEGFGGELPFLAVGIPGPHDVARSFPSGHSSMGFYFFIFYFLATGLGCRRPWIWLLVALAGGMALGTVRVLQGGHWPSDVLWAGGMVWYSALAVSWFLGIFRPEEKALARHGN